MLLGDCRRARDLDRQRGGGFEAFGRQVVGGGEAPAAVVEHAHAEAERGGGGNVAGFAVLGRDVTVLFFDDAHVGVGDAAPDGGVERVAGQIFHRGVISPPSLSCSPEAWRGKRVE